MTTVEALKEVYVSLGGALTDTYPTIADGAPVSDYVTNPDVIAAISVKATGAVELPAVTAEDNGKLLTVVEGVWDKADTPAVLITCKYKDDPKRLTFPTGVTGAYIKGLIDSGKVVQIVDDWGWVYTITRVSNSSGITFWTNDSESSPALTLRKCVLPPDTNIVKTENIQYIAMAKYLPNN